MLKQLLLLFVVSLVPLVSLAQEGTEKKVLKHIVMYKFREDLTPAQVQEVIDAFVKLPKQIDTVIGFEKGTNSSQEGKSEGLTHLFVVTFRDEEGLKKYLAHPAHDEYVKLAKTRREKVVVFDYWAAP